MKLIENLARWLRQPLALVGLAAALTFISVPSASASQWSFTYSGSGVSAAGVFTATLNGGGWWDVTSISGTRNGNAITGLWIQTPPAGSGNDNYFVDSAVGAAPTAGWVDPQLDIHFLVGSDQYILAWIFGGATEADINAGGSANVDYSNTGRCTGTGCTQLNSFAVAVPEINASAGLAALAVLIAFGLIFGEMFRRGRIEAI